MAEPVAEPVEAEKAPEDEGSLFSKKGKGPAFRRRKKKEEDVGDGTAAANSQTAAHLRIQRCAKLRNNYC
jgi:hypothetical protein